MDTNKRIEALMLEANRAGDYEQAALCAIALDQQHLLAGAEPGSVWAEAFNLWAGKSVAERDAACKHARAACLEVIEDAEAMDDSDEDNYCCAACDADWMYR